jgi:hypothetical protein
VEARVRILLSLATLLLVPLAQAAGRGDEASARAAIQARFDAALKADVAALDRLLADDLDYCSYLGTCQTKAQYIGDVKSGVLKYQSIESTTDSVKLFADTAVALGRVAVQATRNGEPRSLRICWTAVLAWRDGRWQLTTWSSTSIDPKAK